MHCRLWFLSWRTFVDVDWHLCYACMTKMRHTCVSATAVEVSSQVSEIGPFTFQLNSSEKGSAHEWNPFFLTTGKQNKSEYEFTCFDLSLIYQNAVNYTGQCLFSIHQTIRRVLEKSFKIYGKYMAAKYIVRIQIYRRFIHVRMNMNREANSAGEPKRFGCTAPSGNLSIDGVSNQPDSVSALMCINTGISYDIRNLAVAWTKRIWAGRISNNSPNAKSRYWYECMCSREFEFTSRSIMWH